MAAIKWMIASRPGWTSLTLSRGTEVNFPDPKEVSHGPVGRFQTRWQLWLARTRTTSGVGTRRNYASRASLWPWRDG